MSMINKDILLADYLDGKISESELLSKHPELSTDIEMIKSSQSALEKLEMIKPQKEFDIKSANSFNKFSPRIWYAAASIILIIGLSLIFQDFNIKKTDYFDENLSARGIDEKLMGLWSIWESDDIDNNNREKLLDLARNNDNSNVRYLALQKLIDQSIKLEEEELYRFLNDETNFNNQTAWIDLWQKQSRGKSEMLMSWLEKDYVNPIVREYGEESIRNF